MPGTCIPPTIMFIFTFTPKEDLHSSLPFAHSCRLAFHRVRYLVVLLCFAWLQASPACCRLLLPLRYRPRSASHTSRRFTLPAIATDATHRYRSILFWPRLGCRYSNTLLMIDTIKIFLTCVKRYFQLALNFIVCNNARHE